MLKMGTSPVYVILKGNVITEDRIGNERNIFGFVLSPKAKNQASRG